MKSKDEIGDLANTLNQMTLNLKNMLITIQQKFKRLLMRFQILHLITLDKDRDYLNHDVHLFIH